MERFDVRHDGAIGCKIWKEVRCTSSEMLGTVKWNETNSVNELTFYTSARWLIPIFELGLAYSHRCNMSNPADKTMEITYQGNLRDQLWLNWNISSATVQYYKLKTILYEVFYLIYWIFCGIQIKNSF